MKLRKNSLIVELIKIPLKEQKKQPEHTVNLLQEVRVEQKQDQDLFLKQEIYKKQKQEEI